MPHYRYNDTVTIEISSQGGYKHGSACVRILSPSKPTSSNLAAALVHAVAIIHRDAEGDVEIPRPREDDRVWDAALDIPHPPRPGRLTSTADLG